MKAEIVYYSMSGNTEWTAKKIAGRTGFGLLRVVPVKAYPDKGAKKYLWGGKSALMKETPELEPYSFDASDLDLIVFGMPVWASNITPPIRTFIEENREALKGKKIAAFACNAGGGTKKALERLKDFLGVDGFAAELSLIDPKERPADGNEEALAAFCAALTK